MVLARNHRMGHSHWVWGMWGMGPSGMGRTGRFPSCLWRCPSGEVNFACHRRPIRKKAAKFSGRRIQR